MIQFHLIITKIKKVRARISDISFSKEEHHMLGGGKNFLPFSWEGPSYRMQKDLFFQTKRVYFHFSECLTLGYL